LGYLRVIFFLSLLNLVNETIDVDAAINYLLIVLDCIGYQMGAIFGETTDAVALYREQVLMGVVIGALAEVEVIAFEDSANVGVVEAKDYQLAFASIVLVVLDAVVDDYRYS